MTLEQLKEAQGYNLLVNNILYKYYFINSNGVDYFQVGLWSQLEPIPNNQSPFEFVASIIDEGAQAVPFTKQEMENTIEIFRNNPQSANSETLSDTITIHDNIMARLNPDNKRS